jgi:hypothetical protein
MSCHRRRLPAPGRARPHRGPRNQDPQSQNADEQKAACLSRSHSMASVGCVESWGQTGLLAARGGPALSSAYVLAARRSRGNSWRGRDAGGEEERGPAFGGRGSGLAERAPRPAARQPSDSSDWSDPSARPGRGSPPWRRPTAAAQTPGSPDTMTASAGPACGTAALGGVFSRSQAVGWGCALGRSGFILWVANGRRTFREAFPRWTLGTRREEEKGGVPSARLREGPPPQSKG